MNKLCMIHNFKENIRLISVIPVDMFSVHSPIWSIMPSCAEIPGKTTFSITSDGCTYTRTETCTYIWSLSVHTYWFYCWKSGTSTRRITCIIARICNIQMSNLSSTYRTCWNTKSHYTEELLSTIKILTWNIHMPGFRRQNFGPFNRECQNHFQYCE
jgi:hypothetical protein